MYQPKTKETDSSVIEFIENVDNPKKREDAYELLNVFMETTGFEAKMWGPSIIGFGSYHYKYESGHEGDAPLSAFHLEKQRSVYTFPWKRTKGRNCCVHLESTPLEKAVCTSIK